MPKSHYFSQQASKYAAFRPTYPEELYAFLFKHVKAKSCAWDCGTGNGQVASRLAKDFACVYATDVSQQQLDHAIAAGNIFYSRTAAERTPFGDNEFDLITAAQALHWFDLPAFYSEVNRTLNADGVLAVWGYALLSVEPSIDEMFLDFYHNTVGAYWDKARKLVEEHYDGVPFPFDEIAAPEFYIRVDWNLEHFTGYLSSWSATQKFIQANQTDPVLPFRKRLETLWPHGEIKRVTFPVFMKLGRRRSHDHVT